MANTRGGLIIYGVIEGPPTYANAIRSVGPVDPATDQNIRRVASNLVYPPVRGLEFAPLHADGGKETILALFVPQSLDAPHLVRPKGQTRAKGQEEGWWFAVPWRNGPDTDWMAERQIDSLIVNDCWRRVGENVIYVRFMTKPCLPPARLDTIPGSWPSLGQKFLSTAIGRSALKMPNSCSMRSGPSRGEQGSCHWRLFRCKHAARGTS